MLDDSLTMETPLGPINGASHIPPKMPETASVLIGVIKLKRYNANMINDGICQIMQYENAFFIEADFTFRSLNPMSKAS